MAHYDSISHPSSDPKTFLMCLWNSNPYHRNPLCTQSLIWWLLCSFIFSFPLGEIDSRGHRSLQMISSGVFFSSSPFILLVHCKQRNPDPDPHFRAILPLFPLKRHNLQPHIIRLYYSLPHLVRVLYWFPWHFSSLLKMLIRFMVTVSSTASAYMYPLYIFLLQFIYLFCTNGSCARPHLIH